MKLKWNIDRKLLLVILSPLARAASSALVGYLTAKGVPAELVGQFADLIGGAGVIAFNVCWELIDRRKAETRAAMRVINDLAPTGSAR
ncbi:hypothetical protein [Rhizobium sp. CSW-27]|uniref:hypothetical protein n=1 Tax=Rhizobium sp. CSW-27 TaxID=2839985 RepID=UPI001C021070|nr:hypothetical protein [Rhizobium sp. CSW-27]MBT9371789.1 hypothetical protein [Rhizobium sp. CSW-27]